MKFIANLVQAIAGLSVAGVFFITTWWSLKMKGKGKKKEIDKSKKEVDRRNKRVDEATKDINDIDHDTIRERMRKKNWFRD